MLPPPREARRLPNQPPLTSSPPHCLAPHTPNSSCTQRHLRQAVQERGAVWARWRQERRGRRCAERCVWASSQQTTHPPRPTRRVCPGQERAPHLTPHTHTRPPHTHLTHHPPTHPYAQSLPRPRTRRWRRRGRLCRGRSRIWRGRSGAHWRLCVVGLLARLAPRPTHPSLPPTPRRQTYLDLVDKGMITPAPDVTPPEVPVDLAAASKAGKARAHSSTPLASLAPSLLPLPPLHLLLPPFLLLTGLACLPACMPACLPACMPACMHACVLHGWRARGAQQHANPPPTHPPSLPPAHARTQVRAPTHVVSSICDDRGEEPTYCSVPMSELMESGATVGDAIRWVGVGGCG